MESILHALLYQFRKVHRLAFCLWRLFSHGKAHISHHSGRRVRLVIDFCDDVDDCPWMETRKIKQKSFADDIYVINDPDGVWLWWKLEFGMLGPEERNRAIGSSQSGERIYIYISALLRIYAIMDVGVSFPSDRLVPGFSESKTKLRWGRFQTSLTHRSQLHSCRWRLWCWNWKEKCK